MSPHAATRKIIETKAESTENLSAAVPSLVLNAVDEPSYVVHHRGGDGLVLALKPGRKTGTSIAPGESTKLEGGPWNLFCLDEGAVLGVEVTRRRLSDDPAKAPGQG